MSAFWNALDNREKAVLIWTLVLVVFMLWKKELRSSFAAGLKALAARPLLVLLLGAMFYVASVVLFAALVGVWTLPLLGVTVFWCFGPAAVMFFNSSKAARDHNYFRRVLRGSLTSVLIVEFLTNLYVFDLVVELVLLPFVTVLVLTAYVAGTKAESAPAKKLLDFLLLFFGIALLARAVTALTLDFDSFATLENLMPLLLAPALTILFLPLIYPLRSYIRWEDRRFQQRWRRDFAAG